jgi:CsoR family transcriptional regulator, copper-sensing transcriptional repressor
MMNEPTKAKLLKRLRRAEGQLAAVTRMVEEDQYCVEILLQISAIRGALSKIGQILLASHIESCVTNALTHGKADARKKKIDELMEVFARYSGLAGA